MGRLKRFRLDFLGGGGAEEERQDLVNKSSPSTFLSRNYIVLTLTSAIWNLGYSITETYFSLYVFELGGTESVIGLVSAVASMSYILSLIIGGQLADVYGRKKVLGITTLALGASQVLLALVPNWQSLVLAVIVVNFCWIGEPAFWAMLADSIREEHRGKAYSLFSSVSFLPWVIMPYIGGKIIDVKGTLVAMRLVYFSLSVLGVLAGILHLSLLNETLTPARDITVSFRNLKGIIGITIRSLKEHFNTWLSMSRPLLALSVTYMLWSLEEGLTGPYWIVYAKEEIGISSSEWGSLVSIGNLVSLALKSFVVGKMLDKFRRMTVLLVVMALDISSYSIFILCRGFMDLLILWVYASSIWAFYEATYSSLEADLIPKERRGRTYAALSASWNVMYIPASLVGGIVYEKVCPEASFISASLIVFLCLLVSAKFLNVKKAD